MTRVLFVCMGNICRSPMAEFVLKDMVEKKGLADRFEIASAGTSAEELGNPVHRGTRAKLREHGIGCEGKTARLLTRSDYDRYDLLIGMEERNCRAMLKALGGDPEGKVRRLLDFTGHGKDIEDPWYTGDFEATWRDVKDGCEGLLRALEGKIL